MEVYFDLGGRLRRGRFFVYSILLWIVVPVLALLGIPLVDNARYPFIASLLVLGAIGLFWLWSGIAMVVKRLHDLDKTGWHYVWMYLLPGLMTGGLTLHWSNSFDGHWSVGYGQTLGVVPLIATLYLLFASGTDGPYKFGYPA